MRMDAVPVWALFAATIVLVVVAIDAGRRLGHAVRRRTEAEKEAPVSAIAAAILGLLAFVLAFTFGIVYDRYDARKELVRDEANAIRTAWLRSDFLPGPDRVEAAGLLVEYVDLRLVSSQSGDHDRIQEIIDKSLRIQRSLWDMAVVNARKDMNSDVAALYIESLNELFNIQALRVAVGLQVRIPAGLWLLLYVLVTLGMIAVGYHFAIAGSVRRSLTTLFIAISFSIVITGIFSLDRRQSKFMVVSQQPLIDVRNSMNSDYDAGSGY